MGLPANLWVATRLDFDSESGPTAIRTGFLPPASSACSSAPRMAGRSVALRLWDGLRGFMRAVQASRLAQAQRQLAVFRQSLPRPEGSFE